MENMDQINMLRLAPDIEEVVMSVALRHPPQPAAKDAAHVTLSRLEYVAVMTCALAACRAAFDDGDAPAMVLIR